MSPDTIRSTPATRFLTLALLSALAPFACGVSKPTAPGGVVSSAQSSGPPGTSVGGFVLLASGSINVNDRTGLNPQILGGDVGAAGTGIPSSSQTVVIGSNATVDTTRVVMGQRVTLRDRAVVGVVRATTITAPFATYTLPLTPFVAPPALPPIRAFTSGGAAVTVNSGQTVPMAAGKKGAVLVKGTLELTGGLYEMASLTFENDGKLVARARSVVRITQGLRGSDRVRISVATTPTALNAGDLRFIVAGVNSGTTSSVLFGNDVTATALFLGSAAMTAGDRFTATGAIAARDIVIGHDAKITFQAGFDCNVDSACADTSTCTTDSCTDAQCGHVALANGTACTDANACTQTDSCQAGLCVGANPKVCSASDQCHVAGVCAPATGVCSNPNATDGTTCSDTNSCTTPDSCQAGACVGTPLTCTTPASCASIGICAVKPILNCVIDQGGDSFFAWFGYENLGSTAVDAAVGVSNQFSPGPGDLAQPTRFQPGKLNFWVSVPFNGTTPITWTLGAAQATATSSSPRCPSVSGGEDDTETDGDAVKFPPPVTPVAPPAQVPQVTSNNLFPRVAIRVVPRPPEPLMFVEQPADKDEDEGDVTAQFVDHDRAIRSVEVVILNNTGLTLSFVDGEFEGEAEVQPPSGISPHSYGDLQSGSDGFLQGTGGHIIYSFNGGTQVRLNWNNPFIGGNDFSSELSGAGSGGFAVDRVGGEGNRATVFFTLRPTTTASTTCPFEMNQWMVDSLRSAEEPLTGFDTASGFLSTPAKNLLGVGKWQTTGCSAPRAVGRVVAVAHSTDRFFTIDAVLDEFNGVFLANTGKAVRLEVAPFGVFGFTTNPAHRAIVNDGTPALGSRIVFSGTVLIDHGAFLEVHPSDPIQTAPDCSTFPPGDPATPLFCNTTLNDFFTWDSGQAPVPMGRAEGRACFLTAMSGAFQSAGCEIHASLDAATNNWFLTGNGSGQSIHGEARCVTVKQIFGETSWSQGQPDVRLGDATSTRGCFLSRISGHFEGGGEEVGISEVLDQGAGNGSQFLGGKSAQAGVGASATCIETSYVSFPLGWGQGNPAIALDRIFSSPTTAGSPGCFLIQVGGRFEGGGERVQIGAATTGSGTLVWTLGGASQQDAVHGGAECMRP